ncbi:MAG: ArsR family transcriptional regulator [Planctomycetota bacterium]
MTAATTAPTLSDRRLLKLLADGSSFGVAELSNLLEVTPTAVRNRLERALAAGWIGRQIDTTQPSRRGRPQHAYQITAKGIASLGVSLDHLAQAMWQTIVEVEDENLREKLLTSVASHLNQRLDQVAEGETENPLVRLQTALEMMDYVVEVTPSSKGSEDGGFLPIVDIPACPYPQLVEADDDRSMCRLEEQLFSKLAGQPVKLSSCRLDGDGKCQFHA